MFAGVPIRISKKRNSSLNVGKKWQKTQKVSWIGAMFDLQGKL
jgi:hypothetical protein